MFRYFPISLHIAFNLNGIIILIPIPCSLNLQCQNEFSSLITIGYMPPPPKKKIKINTLHLENISCVLIFWVLLYTHIYNVLYIKTIYELYIIRFKKDSLTPGFCFVCFQSFYKNSINEMYSMLFCNICL